MIASLQKFQILLLLIMEKTCECIYEDWPQKDSGRVVVLPKTSERHFA
jgi:hypothetical protein